MQHRHLQDPGYTLTAIDDVIERGSLKDWVELADAGDVNGSILDGIRTIVAARDGDQSTIGHDFWRVYLANIGSLCEAGRGRS